MNDMDPHWCKCNKPTPPPVKEVKFRGEVLVVETWLSFHSINIKIDEILEDPTGNLQKGETVNVYGHSVFGDYQGYVEGATFERIFLSDWGESSSDHYVKIIEPTVGNVKFEGIISKIFNKESSNWYDAEIKVTKVIDDPSDTLYVNKIATVYRANENAYEEEVSVGGSVKVCAEYNSKYYETYGYALRDWDHYIKKIEKPDLIIQDISWSPSNPKQGDTVTINIITKNKGSGNTGGFDVCYYVDGSYHDRYSVSSLSAGSTTTTNFTWTAECGTHSIKAVADCYNAVAESDEGNNDRTQTMDIVCDTTSPSVTVISPNGGEMWQVGTEHDITWTATDNIGVTFVDICYSTDGGSTYPYTIATGELNDGTYTWTIPNLPSKTCKVKVIAYDAAGNTGEDVSDGNFEISGIEEYNPKISIPDGTPHYEEGFVGTMFQFVITVTNEGTAEDTISLSISDTNSWAVDLSDNSVTLDAGKSKDVKVNVVGEEEGIDWVTIEAKSNHDETKSYEQAVMVKTNRENPLTIIMHCYKFDDILNEVHPRDDYLKVDRVGTSITLYFDLDMETSSIRDGIVKLEQYPGPTMRTLTFEFPDFILIPTNFHVWRDGYKFENYDGMWGRNGVCYGMSNTALLYYIYDQKNGGIKRPEEYKTTYEIPEEDAKLDIVYYQDIHPHFWFWQYDNNYKQLKSYIKSKNEPMNLHLIDSKNPFREPFKHAIVAYKIVEINDKAYIYVYDPNYEREFRVATFDNNTKEFSYVSSSGVKFPHFNCKPALNLGKQKKTMLSIECPINATITDQYGRIISDDGTNEIPDASMIITKEMKIFYLPADLAYSVDIDAYDSGTFNFTRVSPIGTDILITKFENISVTASTKVSVEIEPRVTDYTMSIDYDGDGVTDEEKSPDVNETIDVEQNSYTIQLHSGWNLISIPLVPEDTNIDSVFSSMAGNYSIVWTTTSTGGWKSSNQTFGKLTEITVDKGYLIYMTAPDTLVIEGTKPDTTTIDLVNGWNLVGYPSRTTRSITDVLSGVSYDVVWTTTSTGGWKSSNQAFGKLTDMSPGKGYTVYAQTSGSYTVS
jgi:hypothetical protein